MGLIYTALEQSSQWITQYLPAIYSGLCASCISALMDLRTQQSLRRTLTGAPVCGVFSLTASALLAWLGLPANSGAFLGALFGFVGADHLREIAIVLVHRRTGTDDKEDKT